MILGMEYGSGVPGVVAPGFNSVVELGVPDLVAISVLRDFAHRISGAVYSMFIGLVSLGFHLCSQSI